MRAFLIALVLLVVVLGGVAYFFNWLNVSTINTPHESGISIRVDKDKIKEDAAIAQEKARELTGQVKDDARAIKEGAEKATKELSEQARTLMGRKKVEGRIVAVDTTARAITVRAEEKDQEVRLEVAPDAAIRVGAVDSSMDRLAVGDKVVVAYETRDGHEVARSVTVGSPQ